MNKDADKWIFSTEGHIFKLDEQYQDKNFLENDFFDVERFHRRNSTVQDNIYKVFYFVYSLLFCHDSDRYSASL